MYEGEAELLVSSINLCANRWVSQPPVSNSQYKRLSDITNRVCRQLRRQFQHNHMVRNLRKRNTTMVFPASRMNIIFCLGHILRLILLSVHRVMRYRLALPQKGFYWFRVKKKINKTNGNRNSI